MNNTPWPAARDSALVSTVSGVALAAAGVASAASAASVAAAAGVVRPGVSARARLQPLPQGALALVIRLVSGRQDPRAAPLVCRFGAQGRLEVDFAARTVRLDPEAAARLDEQQTLPSLVAHDGAMAGTLARDLDDVLWDLGQACRRWELLGAGDDAWQQPLVADPAMPLRRLLRLPLPLPLAQLLLDAERVSFTPAQVQQACALSADATRGLLQACLLLGLVRWHWSADDTPPQPAAAGPLATDPDRAHRRDHA